MPILDSQYVLFGQENASGEVSAPLLLSLELSGELNGSVKRRIVFSPIGLSLDLSGDLTGRRRKPTDLAFRLDLSGEMTGSARLALIVPAPILNEVADGAFQNEYYAARLIGSGVEIKISSAVIEKPKNEIGLKVSANISKKQLSEISLDKSYTFQVGVAATPIVPLTWHTILENAQLDSRTYSRAFSNKAPADSLSIGLIAPVTNKLNLGPKKNIILYDPAKTEISADGIEGILDNNGDAVETQLVPVGGLNLYAILDRLRIEAGFSAVETNIPNYEITRAEFPITQTFNQSIAPFIGVFQPLIFAVGNVLWILDKTAEIPDEFAPRAIVAANLENLSVSIPSGNVPDGFELTYIDSDRAANFSTTRTVTTFEDTGTYGDAAYTRTDVVRTFRDWKNTANPTSVLRTELLSEVHSTYDSGLNLIGRETQNFVFDAQGKQKSSVRIIEAEVPNLAAGGTVQLLTVRRETQNIYYKPDPKSPRKFLQNRIVTEIWGMVAIDTENTTLDKNGNQVPYVQAIIRVWDGGNLTIEMDTDFKPLKTVTETLTSLGNGQYQVRVSTIDHLLGATTNSYSEPKTGDATLSGVGGRSSKKIVWRTGINQSNRSGIPVESMSGGEVPLFFLEPLLQRILQRRAEGKHQGSITAAGFDPSMDSGVFFSLYDRDNSYFGRFIAEGLRVTLDNLGVAGQQKVTTAIDCEEI